MVLFNDELKMTPRFACETNGIGSIYLEDPSRERVGLTSVRGGCSIVV